jgi:hypothetical protein
MADDLVGLSDPGTPMVNWVQLQPKNRCYVWRTFLGSAVNGVQFRVHGGVSTSEWLQRLFCLLVSINSRSSDWSR